MLPCSIKRVSVRVGSGFVVYHNIAILYRAEQRLFSATILSNKKIMISYKAYFPVIMILLCCGFGGCHSLVEDIPQFVPQPERIVIGALLTAGDSIRYVFISHTTAPLDTLVNSSLEGISAVLHVDDKVVTLRQQRNISDTVHLPLEYLKGLFFEAPGVRAEAGKRYSITVQWQGKTAQATTFVPQPAIIDSLAIYAQLGTQPTIILDAILTPRPKEVYFINQIHRVQPPSYPYLLTYQGDFSTGLRIQDTLSNGKLFLRSLIGRGYSNLAQNLPSYQSSAQVYAFDEAYWEYYKTSRYDNIHYDGNPFVSQRTSVKGNVTGDGLGIFAGVNLRVVRVPH